MGIIVNTITAKRKIKTFEIASTNKLIKDNDY